MIGIDVSPLLLERRRGVARALHTLLVGLSARARDLPVRLLCPRPPVPDDDLPTLDGVVHPPTPATTARAFRRVLPALLREAGCRAWLSPWLATADADLPTVVLVHELPFVRLGPVEGRFRARRQRAWLRRHDQRGRTLVVPSAATRDDVLALRPGLAGRVHVVPHGFDPRPWRAAARAPDEPPYAVVVGTGKDAAGARKKGLDLVAPLARRLAGRLRIEIRGDTHVEEDALRRLVAGARVLVYPSRSEGFGFPPLEAMAAGVPVVTTTAGSIPEVVGEAALTVASGDADALQEAVEIAAFHAATRRRLIAAGTARADAFPVAAMADGFARLLDFAATSHAASAGAPA